MMGESHNTVNGITVLGAGPATPVIFKSGRRSTTPKLLQRSGSTLEILTESAGSKKNELQPDKLETKKDRVNSSCSWSSRKHVDTTSTDWNTVDDTTLCSGAHKKVVLPSVKRNFEKQGMPNNEVIESFIRSTTPTLNESCVHRTPPTLNESCVHSTKPIFNESCAKREPKPNSSIGINSLESGLCGIQLQPKESAAKDASEQVTTLSDDYYVSHGYRESSCDELNSDTPKHSRECKRNVKKPSEIQKPSIEDEDKDENSEESEGEEDERKAPIELLGEFLEAVMDEDFENAQKLCQMILIYEPDNKEANEFKPLIDVELRKERERQLWGSSSEDESSDEDEESDEETDASADDDDDDDDDDDEDDEEKTDDESDEDSN